MFEYGRRDEDLFHTANCLVKGGMPPPEIEQVLERLIISWGEDSNHKWVRTKVESAMKRAERRERNFADDLRKWVMSTDGHFSVTEYHAEARLSTREDKHAVTECCRRMVEEGILEKYGDKRGVYRRIDKTLKRIDLKDKSDLRDELDLRFVFGIETFIKVMPGIVSVIAGETDSGKSAYLMNFAKLNCDKYRVHYFTTEMGKEEFLDRTQYFWPGAEDHPNFNFYEKGSNFQDAIFPDDINIIDYIKLFDKFYLMAELIENIGKKLKNGMAFIALQKPPGREEGVGGQSTKDLARLYLALSHGKLKIVKAKNWRNPKNNPNRLAITFSLRNGCEFIQKTSWTKEDD